MAADVLIPRLGWSMEEGVFGGWLKRSGDVVRPGDPLFTLDGEKATQEVEAVDGGILHVAPDAPAAGQTVAVGRLVARICAAGETPVWTDGTRPSPAAEPAPPAAGGEWPAPAPRRPAGDPPARLPKSSPRARRAASDLGVDLSGVVGGGSGRRIRERDVRAAASAGPATPPGHEAGGPAVPISPTRRVIARQMVDSRDRSVPVTLTAWADATALLAARAAGTAAEGPDAATINDILLKLLAESILAHPVMAARWDDTHLTLPGGRIDIGLAVDAPGGLVVPVVRDVAALPLPALARRTRALVRRARSGGLAADEMRGGVFTLTSLGSYGIEFFTPVINPPQSAILGVGTIRMQPVPPAGGLPGIVLQSQLPLSLTFDHRVVDGGPAARFLGDLAGRIAGVAPAADAC